MLNMKASKQLLRRFMADESGLSAVEYALLAAGIAVALWNVVPGFGQAIGGIFTKVQTDLTTP